MRNENRQDSGGLREVAGQTKKGYVPTVPSPTLNNAEETGEEKGVSQHMEDANTHFTQNITRLQTFLRRVLTMNSRASDSIGAISSGFNTILLSNGSPEAHERAHEHRG